MLHTPWPRMTVRLTADTNDRFWSIIEACSQFLYHCQANLQATSACRWDAPQPPLLQLLRTRVPGLAVCVAESHSELLRQLHLKLAINCCINPITALLGCENGALAATAGGGGAADAAAAHMR